MQLYHAIILGIVQGLTELLPISSSAHLWAVPYLFAWPEQSLAFDTALHFGTAIAVIAYFWADWKKILQNTFAKEKNAEYPKNFFWQILVATIPAGIVGVLIEKSVETALQKPLIIATTMSVFGLILWLVDKFVKSSKKTVVNFSDSFVIGCAQCLALIPGISRSGITLIAARSLGYNREKSARFSFLIGTPAILGAFLFEARKLTHADLNLPFFAGVLFAAIFGFLAIKFLLNYLKKGNFAVFAVYRFVFAIIILLAYFSR